jgi:hypothetical protein
MSDPRDPPPPVHRDASSAPVRLEDTRHVSALLRGQGEPDSPLAPLYQVNERCLMLLAEAARQETRCTSPLVIALRRPLLAMTPEMRARASRRALLLLDMAFRDFPWWFGARAHPRRATRTLLEPELFPAPSARPLARATLVLAWHSVRADRIAASALLGLSRPVAEIIAGLTLEELDWIAERRFRTLRPRWEDRPEQWRKLLLSAEGSDFRRGREFNVQSLKLLAGELLASEVGPRPLPKEGDSYARSRR